MMSVEEQLGNAVQACNNLAAAVNGKVSQIDAKIDEAVRQIPEFDKLYYVHSSGNDANAGTEGEPLLTISEAINRTPVGGAVTVRLSNGDAVYFGPQNDGDTGSSSYTIKKKTVQVESKTGHGIDMPDATSNVPKVYLNRDVLLDSAVLSFGRYFYGVVVYQSRVFPTGSNQLWAKVRNRYGSGGETLDMLGSLINFAHSSIEQNYESLSTGVKVNLRKTKVFANLANAYLIAGGVSALGVSEAFMYGDHNDTYKWFGPTAVSYDASGSPVNILVSSANLLV